MHILRAGLMVAYLLLCFLCSSCAGQTHSSHDEGIATIAAENAAAINDIADIDNTAGQTEAAKLTPEKSYLINNYDKIDIDGSTSMIPLHQSINDLFSTKYTKVEHSKTVEAFEKFITGETAILLGVDYSDELLKQAEKKGIALVKREITREGFVFLINKNNPVKSLTVEQIKDIYSGKITNWSEVGGDNAPIKAYQRNQDSGSQIRMVKFMGGTKLAHEYVDYLSSMGWVVEMIGSYDEGKYSIAYNMYTFTEKQYTNYDVALLAVNGVQPNDGSIFNETYPLTIYNYIYYDANNAFASEFANNLYVYLMSDEGQALISSSGYINLNKQYDRNKHIMINNPYEHESFYEEKDLGWYNEEKGEFYDLDWYSGKLLVFDNYPDYVLHDTKYSDNEQVREFLLLLFNSNYEIEPLAVWIDEDKGIISFVPWNDVSYDPYDIFTFKYNDKYYERFYYYVDEGKYMLNTAGKEVLEYFADDNYFNAFKNDIEFDYTIEITKEDLKNLYVKASEYPHELEEFEYFLLF
jgi:phosphate transport system substrate-binding protein